MMEERHALDDEQWERLAGLVPGGRGRPGGSERRFLNALMWIATTGSPWRDLPSAFGAWNVVYQRFSYWCKKGWLEAIFLELQQPDWEAVMMDSTCCRAHQASAGARKSSGPQAIGVTRGGLNTKIHALCDALGNPVRLVLTPGQRHDSKVAVELLKDVPAKAVVADKAYDSNEIVDHAQENGMEVVIPPKANRKQPRAMDKAFYKARHLVENLFQRMKVFRRVATRFEKLDCMFLGFVHLAAIKKWLH
jgi:transposase